MSEVCGSQDFFMSMVTCMLCVQSAEQWCSWTDVVSFKQFSCQALGIHREYGELQHFQAISLSLILSSLFLSFPLSMACVCTRVAGVKCGCVLPSAVEGEYNPWERELQQGLWLQHLSDEEDSGTRKGTRTLSPLPGEAIKEQVPHEEFFCALFHCVTSSLKTDSVAVVHLLVQVP